MSVLDKVQLPKDIKKMNNSELDELCADIRELLVETVSETGGHLASNLGVVELSVALHKVFNSPTDQIVFDVGHQCYTHKILTGRKDRFSTLRTEGGISGFVRPVESEHDIFSSGHSSVAISQAIGLAKAKKIKGEKGKVIAVIGDGALTGGLAYEAFNNGSYGCENLIVILNDNNMSISQNVGSMSKHLTTIRTSKQYFTFKAGVRRIFAKIPKIGNSVNRLVTFINTEIRKKVYHATFFEDLDFRYYGPIDGHDIESLISVLTAAKTHSHSVLIHVNTIKGKGYNPAEKNPTQFHGIGKFNVATGECVSGGKNFSSAFGDTMCSLAEKDGRICCVTAAMAEGTGLSNFAKLYPKRFFDVGIAEQHAVTFSSGLAKNGLVPVFAVYSTFLQRSYDQLIHDVAMQNIKVIFGIDRAGFVGEDGESHQGIFDVSYLNTVPGLTVYAPSCYEELSLMFGKAIYHDNGAAAIRYPRGKENEMPEDYHYDKSDYSVFGGVNSENCIITYGREFSECYAAYKELDNTFIIKLNKIKPVEKSILTLLADAKNVYFYEESIKTGSVGEIVAAMLKENNIDVHFKHIAIEDEFVKQATIESQIKTYKLDRDSIVNEVSNV
ncbi:MAG: 1-deoxy-D-xylulose-5-phosphate synthase [Eubacterium sp.]|jgi:1-deoxy-D-xylulose-5-phosphate synthase|nr:1-deoxy-D-xylulose-5-phosphate synthase [Eubacterium sp.]